MTQTPKINRELQQNHNETHNAQPSSTLANCPFYLVVVADYPVVEHRDRLCKGGSERRERILDAWWYFVVIMPPNQSVSLKLAQRLGEHLL